MGVDVRLYDFMAEEKSRGRAAMNAHLIETTAEWRPDVAMFSLYTDQILPETVTRLRSLTKTLCFFHDDTWRVEFSRAWARVFDFVTTPDVYGQRKYQRVGITNVIPFPFGCHDGVYQKLPDSKKIHDVSFVGSWHPYREWLLDRLRKAGFSVYVAGYGWPHGAVDQEEMIRIFNQSRVNLNLSNSVSWDARYLLQSPRGFINRMRSPKSGEQLKARVFELACCGAFELSYYVEGLERYFLIGDEIGIYTDPDDLSAQVRFYLEDDDLRERIASAGYARAHRDHTFRARFKTVFARMGVTDA